MIIEKEEERMEDSRESKTCTDSSLCQGLSHNMSFKCHSKHHIRFFPNNRWESKGSEKLHKLSNIMQVEIRYLDSKASSIRLQTSFSVYKENQALENEQNTIHSAMHPPSIY